MKRRFPNPVLQYKEYIEKNLSDETIKTEFSAMLDKITLKEFCQDEKIRNNVINIMLGCFEEKKSSVEISSLITTAKQEVTKWQ